MAKTDINISGKVLLSMAATFLGTLLIIWATGQNERAFRPTLTKITLTTAGCEYVQRQTGLPEKTVGKIGSCEVEADFTQYSLSSGGTIFYGNEDSESLEISESQVVGTVKMPKIPNKPWTHNQKVSVWQLAFSYIFMLSNFIFIVVQLNKPKRKNEN
ncbi:MAG: hypothetical protein NTY60_09910 [Proteobacteria bacterium]|nr:hypothetical protein [Pseudomonadota bacterium]